MYPIDKNIPLPPHTGHICKYPFREMEVGDSFFLPREDVGKRGRPLFSKHGQQINIKLTVRKVKDGWRIWRTA